MTVPRLLTAAAGILALGGTARAADRTWRPEAASASRSGSSRKPVGSPAASSSARPRGASGYQDTYGGIALGDEDCSSCGAWVASRGPTFRHV